MDTERVVVTGLGMTTPLGGDVPTTWQALMQGRSGVRALPGPEYAGLPVRIGALVANEPGPSLTPVEQRRWDRTQQLAMLAARQSWHDAGFDDTAEASGLDPERVGAVVGTGIGGLTTVLERHDAFLARGWTALSPFTVTMTMPSGPAATVCREFGVRGGVHAPVGACAAGAEAISQAVAMIRSGQVDVVLAGGTEAAIHPLTVAGFAAMRALSRRNDDPPRASRPFDADRDGFVLGEGAAILVLESAKHAADRGIRTYAEMFGVGISSDPSHLVRTDPNGLGAQLAMRRALLDARAEPEQVVHLNAHATGTPAGDITEARAIRTVLGPDVLVTSTKSMTGHLLGAAGAVEAILAVLALQNRLAPPTINFERPDRGVELRMAAREPCPLPANVSGQPPLVMSNSFGFGGHCVSLAIGPG
ncbi:MAG: beta-ketoacyl-[acyl-carrier-protein] synthase family protein [Acidimicrobiales bacterium]